MIKSSTFDFTRVNSVDFRSEFFEPYMSQKVEVEDTPR
uniref:Uncharacterized protein n=1 Tax=Arundo donax TaxID=35708 RepID=A0A0A9AWN8_ARUDO